MYLVNFYGIFGTTDLISLEKMSCGLCKTFYDAKVFWQIYVYRWFFKCIIIVKKVFSLIVHSVV